MSNAPYRPGAVAAVLLAAGASRRFGGNKLLAAVSGETLIRRAAAALAASAVGDIVVVTGPEPENIAAALRGLPVRYRHNAEHSRGMGRSIAAGIASLRPNAAGALVCLGDMPSVTASLIDLLIARFEQTGRNRIVYPCDAAGRQGHPVLWPPALFAELAALEGDRGGKHLLARHADRVESVTVSDAGAFRDIDTKEDLESSKGTGEGG